MANPLDAERVAGIRRRVTTAYSDLRAWRPTRSQKQFLMFEVVCVVMLLPIAVWGARSVSEHYWIGVDTSETNCMPWRIFAIEKTRLEVKDLRRGDVVAVSAPARLEPFVKEGTALGKIVFGMPGDKISISKAGIRVNDDAGPPIGYLYGNAIDRANKIRKKNSLTPVAASDYYREFVVPEGEVFLMGVKPYSQDSRYFGPFSATLLRGRVMPIF